MNESEMWEQAVLTLLKREPVRAYCKTMIADQFPGLRGAENTERFKKTMESLIRKGFVKTNHDKKWLRYEYAGDELCYKDEIILEVKAIADKVITLIDELQHETFRLRDYLLKTESFKLDKREYFAVRQMLDELNDCGYDEEVISFDEFIGYTAGYAKELKKVL